MVSGSEWPALPLDGWRDTKDTLHRFLQIVGKVRLDLVPFRAHWWHVTLHLATRGITTGPMPAGERTVEILLDVLDHRVHVLNDVGGRESFDLADGRSIADLHQRLFDALGRLGAHPTIRAQPYDLPPPPFAEDTTPRHYDADAVERYWRVLQQVERTLAEFAGWFNGKQSPAHLFWHSFDLAMARFSGRPAPVPDDGDPVTAEAYSHEVIAFGFWPGDDDVPAPTFYSYTSPEPPNLTEQPLRPAAASWQPTGGTAHLPYDQVRTAEDPRGELLAFLQSTYEAGARTAGWDLDAFATRAHPTRGRS